MKSSLIREIRKTDPSTLEDLILIMAINVETSLLEAGAEPGKDYSFRDLWTWATPFALEAFKNKQLNISYKAIS